MWCLTFIVDLTRHASWHIQKFSHWVLMWAARSQWAGVPNYIKKKKKEANQPSLCCLKHLPPCLPNCDTLTCKLWVKITLPCLHSLCQGVFAMIGESNTSTEPHRGQLFGIAKQSLHPGSRVQWGDEVGMVTLERVMFSIISGSRASCFLLRLFLFPPWGVPHLLVPYGFT